MTALYRPSAQVKKGDRFLDQARNLRDKWKDLIPSGDLVTLQNRITLASEMRVGLDSKSGLSKISHARTYRKYTLETLRIVKATSDRARDANVIIINDETQEEQRQRIVGVAETIYRSFFGYKDPFPTPEQESIWVKSVWAMACVKTGTEMSLSTDLAEKLNLQLAKAGPRFRDDIKKRVTPLVERHYKFVTNKSPESFNENAELSRRLKTDAYFSDTTEGKLGLPYRHPIIQQVINIVWFNDRSGDGVVFSNNFNPMPYETIALVLTVIKVSTHESATHCTSSDMIFVTQDVITQEFHAFPGMGGVFGRKTG
ncbi:hypothetical protein B0F90DRAFT_1820121 [Multifurca ochricompacta]|uniref:DUF6532 domain-containing protein n=1 Tax=Multifurca ochricompacta TaxID=376703 RepID=A0AAD4M1H6_9AGAM|nr:hypothetical protein B0F90DRAFT_1820121 [Multifurca ochricompacta]